ncbi:MAG: hypothetical protein AAGI52_00305 [Bacteroidota bacterium]
MPVAGLSEALARAALDADAVPGAYSRAPWAFRPATAGAAAVLEGLGESDYQWVIVTCRRSDSAGHVRERAYTAVQRYLLSLAAEDVEATWIGSGLPTDLALRAEIGADEEMLGVIRVTG